MWLAYYSHIDPPVFIALRSFTFQMATSHLEVCFCIALTCLVVMETEVIRFQFKYLLVLFDIGIDDGAGSWRVWMFGFSLFPSPQVNSLLRVKQ